MVGVYKNIFSLWTNKVTVVTGNQKFLRVEKCCLVLILLKLFCERLDHTPALHLIFLNCCAVQSLIVQSFRINFFPKFKFKDVKLKCRINREYVLIFRSVTSQTECNIISHHTGLNTTGSLTDSQKQCPCSSHVASG